MVGRGAGGMRAEGAGQPWAIRDNKLATMGKYRSMVEGQIRQPWRCFVVEFMYTRGIARTR